MSRADRRNEKGLSERWRSAGPGSGSLFGSQDSSAKPKRRKVAKPPPREAAMLPAGHHAGLDRGQPPKGEQRIPTFR